EVGRLPRLECRLGQDLSGEAEDFSPFQPDLRTARALGAIGAGRDIDEVTAGAVGSKYAGLDAGAIDARPQHHRARAVTEDDTGATVLEVDDLGERLTADHDRLLRLAATDETVGHTHRVEEAGAGCLHVEGRAVGA